MSEIRPLGAAGSVGEVTRLLQAWSAGSHEARDRVFPIVYGELRGLAAAYLRRERHGRVSLQATALVNEAFVRLVQNRAPWRDRVHFFGVAAQAMRRILVDHARRRRALKRAPEDLKLTLDAAVALAGRREVDLVALDDALAGLARLDRRQAQIVELRFFAGLSIEDAAEALEISAATVKREWATARAWLAREMRRAPPR